MPETPCPVGWVAGSRFTFPDPICLRIWAVWLQGVLSFPECRLTVPAPASYPPVDDREAVKRVADRLFLKDLRRLASRPRRS